MRWRAWYADGRMYSSSTPVTTLPRDGLVLVMVYHAPPYRTVHHGEYIYWHADQWATAVTPAEIPAGALTFPGVLMTDAEWLWLQAEAFATTEAP